MQHDHSTHDHAPPDYGRAFAIGIAVNLAYVGGEAAAGVVSGSMALLADAGHNLGDVLGLVLSWGAAILSRRRPSGRFTYGLRSSSILAALANAVILLVVTGGDRLGGGLALDPSGVGGERGRGLGCRRRDRRQRRDGAAVRLGARARPQRQERLYAYARRHLRHRRRRRRRGRDRPHRTGCGSIPRSASSSPRSSSSAPGAC